ncbi:Quercetin 2,3-dioxygenase [Aliarcobacter thereius]|uniref:Pirin family protein n=1 Tax=Aliarcobacter thereius TaxID=544718 RepID=A0A1C0B7L5_9BACT|nr:pirin family protein [Aliarcobacter thereius]OCL87866.1 Quercetin 2,3-dioxygenase [Aliarcobacter thereius]OCL99574.1 Quercetin 2,3-dioxygenase [Aliarcobacter thereius]TLS72964.1 pirin family protein [Aliarcobacter thereius]
MKIKNIEMIVRPREAHWVGDGFRVHNFIPSSFRMDMQRMTPFILLDYNSKYNFPASETPKGVGVHPHRGFETVTIAYKGRVEHKDSSGGGGIIGEGDVQWMTAASGILHKEFHEKEWSKKGGDFHMVQLWVNLPAKDKMSEAKYQAITKEQMGKELLENNAGFIEVIAGSYNKAKGPVSTFTPINLMNANLKKGANVPFSFPENFTTALLVIEGSIKVNSKDEVATDHFVLFENDGENFIIQANEDSIILILSGEPINEPIVSHGPFVMNTKEEIAQAFEDFGKGKFGHLE